MITVHMVNEDNRVVATLSCVMHDGEDLTYFPSFAGPLPDHGDPAGPDQALKLGDQSHFHPRGHLMTDSDLREAILANPGAKALADAGNDAGCASLMSSSLPASVGTHFLAEGGILLVLGVADGNVALSAIESAAQAHPARPEGRIRPGPREGGPHPPGQGRDRHGRPHRPLHARLLQSAGLLTADSVSKLKATALRPASIAPADVSRSWSTFRPDGRIGTQP